jgi:dihydropyrimidinase
VTGEDKAVLVRGGTVVNSDVEFQADVLSIGEKIVSVAPNIEPPTGLKLTTIEADGCYVMPGGIDPQTHMEIPFMGTRAIDDFYTGLAAAQTGGTTMLMDFVIPGKGMRLMEAWEQWNEWASKAAGDYSFHVAITWWDDSVYEDMGTLAGLGVNSFKHFLAYKGAIMADDEIMVKSFSRCAELGCMATIHAENGEVVSYLQQQLFDSGVTGPEGHPASRPPEVEGEAANRALRIGEMIGIPVYIVHTSSRDAMEAVALAKARGQVCFSEVLSQHLVIDDSVYLNPDWREAAHFVMSPPFRPKKHQETLWNALTSGIASTTATDHCSFTTEQKMAGRDDFRIIPNGTGGLEDRMSILWHHGVNSGKLTRNQFVDVCSSNAAKIFNIYPRKGVVAEGADADLCVWDPEASRVITQENQYQKCDFNIFEGMEVKGVNKFTVLRGRVTYNDGVLDEEGLRGYGKFIPRPTHSRYFEQARTLHQKRQIQPVERARN